MDPSLSLQDLLDPVTLQQLADDDADGAPDPTVLSSAIASAETEALALAGEVSHATQEPILVLAVERLFLRRRQPVPDDWRRRIDAARRMLAGLRDGVQRTGASPPTLTNDTLRGY